MPRMNWIPHLGLWDAALLTAAPIQATAIAYLHAPRWKALVLTLPIPFTLATLALGGTVDATNVMGLVLLLGFMHGVRLLYVRLGVPIIVSIVVCAAAYCGVGSLLRWVLPTGTLAFWLLGAVVFLLAGVLYLVTPHRVEPGHRSPLPVYVKFTVVLVVVAGLVALKSVLHGFITVFPMVGVIAVYEARKSLWTICRQIPLLMLTLLLMMATIRLLESRIGVAGALAAAWAVFFAALLPLTKNLWAREQLEESVEEG
jgi:hypothetical protein